MAGGGSHDGINGSWDTLGWWSGCQCLAADVLAGSVVNCLDVFAVNKFLNEQKNCLQFV